MAPLLLAGNYPQVSTAVVLRWATSTEQEAVQEAHTALHAMVVAKTPGAKQAEHDLQQMWGVDERYRTSVIGTLSTHLDAWKEPALERATADDGDGITPEWLLDGNNTLFLSAPAAEQRRLRGLFCAVVIEVVNDARLRRADRRPDRRLPALHRHRPPQQRRTASRPTPATRPASSPAPKPSMPPTTTSVWTS